MKKEKRKIIKNQSYWRGNLITFQHYLNTHYDNLPFEEREGSGSDNLFKIEEWYKNGILIKVIMTKVPFKRWKIKQRKR